MHRNNKLSHLAMAGTAVLTESTTPSLITEIKTLSPLKSSLPAAEFPFNTTGLELVQSTESPAMSHPG